MAVGAAPLVRRGDPAALEAALRLARPVSLSGEQRLDVLEAFQPLFPGGALQRGSVVGVRGAGSRSLSIALAAGPAQGGSWTMAFGLNGLGLAAVGELGVVLSRLVVVPAPTVEAIAAAIDSVDVVLVNSRVLSSSDARRLQSRARDRGCVLVLLGPPPLEPDVTLEVVKSQWEGIDDGAGVLRSRRVTVVGGGRRAAARPRRADIWLPDADGRVRPAGAELHQLSVTGPVTGP